MKISPTLTLPSSSALPLEKLAGTTALSQSQKVAELSRQFEAILLRQIITEAQKPAFPSKFNPQSTASGIRQDMLANQLADSITRGGGLGLGRQLEHDLNRQLKPVSPGAPEGKKAPPPPTAELPRNIRWKP
jgi:Rod binding domain-containing protein